MRQSAVHIKTYYCQSAFDHCESSVITAQNYPTTRSQLVAIAVPGQGPDVDSILHI